MVSALILLVFRWHILEITEMWSRSKENCSSDATSVYVCESNKEFWENTIAREFIIEWVINRATASLSLLNTSGSVAMDRCQWVSNTYAWHYMLTFTASHTQVVKINRDNKSDTTTCATASDPCCINMQINGSCWDWMAIGFKVASECKYEAMQWLVMRKYALLAFEYQLLQFDSNLAKLKSMFNDINKIR